VIITLQTVRRHAARGTLEVEHVLRAAVPRPDGLPALLEALCAAEGWSDGGLLPDGRRVAPMARWARVAAAYCRDGTEGLRAVLRAPGHDAFVLALLQEVHSVEAVEAIFDLYAGCFAAPASDPALAERIASALNLILCSKPLVTVREEDVRRIRDFAAAQIALATTQVERASGVLLLRAVGDETSLALLDGLPPFTDAWKDTIPHTRRAIRARLAAAARSR
jgi:hypothetical protein